MSRSQVVAEHLPLLRRYARALTGSQSSGDAYVAAMLEALLQDSSLLEETHGARAGLFRLFTRIWNSVSVNDNVDVTSSAMPPERPPITGLPQADASRNTMPKPSTSSCSGRAREGITNRSQAA